MKRKYLEVVDQVELAAVVAGSLGGCSEAGLEGSDEVLRGHRKWRSW